MGSPSGQRRAIPTLVVEEFLRGAREAGADTENISLAKMNIKPCINCFTC